MCLWRDHDLIKLGSWQNEIGYDEIRSYVITTKRAQTIFYHPWQLLASVISNKYTQIIASK